MEVKFALPQELIDEIVNRVVERLLPQLEFKEHENELLTVTQVASLLCTSREQIYQWVSNSKHGLSDFPFRKAGRALRFSKKDVIHWTKKHGEALEKR